MEKNAMDRKQETVEQLDGEEGPMILEEFDIEDLFIDGICGVY
jgi:mycofactocin precursor